MQDSMRSNVYARSPSRDSPLVFAEEIGDVDLALSFVAIFLIMIASLLEVLRGTHLTVVPTERHCHLVTPLFLLEKWPTCRKKREVEVPFC